MSRWNTSGFSSKKLLNYRERNVDKVDRVTKKTDYMGKWLGKHPVYVQLGKRDMERCSSPEL